MRKEFKLLLVQNDHVKLARLHKPQWKSLKKTREPSVEWLKAVTVEKENIENGSTMTSLLDTLIEWFMEEGLLAKSQMCSVCEGEMLLVKCEDRSDSVEGGLMARDTRWTCQ